MRKPFAFSLLSFAFCCLLFPQSPSPTPSCLPPRPVALDHWRGEYFNNRDLAGSPVMVRDEGVGDLDFDWGLESPSKECNVAADEFSVRWTRTVAFGAGAYRFTITSDDGVRLLIDGQERFSNWQDHPLAVDTVEVALTAGNHRITLEYYERWGSAVAKLKWAMHPCIAQVSSDHWRGEYFANEALQGQPAMVRDDGEKTLFFDWPASGPGSACVANAPALSARWSRKVAFGNGFYRFRVQTNAAVRVLVDSKLQFDAWRGGAINSQFDLPLEAGNHLVVYEFRRIPSSGNAARISLMWEALPCFAEVPQDHWRAEFFNNDSLNGSPTAMRDDGDARINFNWTDGSPTPTCGVRSKSFSARWTRAALFSNGLYHFLLAGNGGVRFLIDGQLKFESWRPSPFKHSFEIEMAAGNHLLTLEFADLGGKANISLNWLDPPCVATFVPAEHWRAEYFAGKFLTGRPAVVRDEGTRAIDFEQGLRTPQPDCADFDDDFSARWSRTATFEAAIYRFTITTDDGARLFVDGRSVIDEWRDQAEATFAVDVEMTAGKHRVVLEYYENTGSAIAHLSWKVAPCSDVIPLGHWRAEYFNNPNLDGKPVMTRDDGVEGINHDWGLKGPDGGCGIHADNFSARWTRSAAFGEGLYRFTVTADDGMRVYLDGRLRLDRWADQAATYTFDAQFAAGNHQITIEYFEHWGSAVAKLGWERHPCFADVPPDRWRGEYFNNPALAGPPAMVRDDGEGAIGFDWGLNSPAPGCGVNRDDFSVRWSRKLILETGWHRFTMTGDDGVRLWINGRKVIDEWRNQQPATFHVDVNLPAGSHRIVLEYYDHTGGATAKFNWTAKP